LISELQGNFLVDKDIKEKVEQDTCQPLNLLTYQPVINIFFS